MNDGGPAFPRAASEFTKNGTCADGNDPIPAQGGMSLRDYFAAAALQGQAAYAGLEGERPKDTAQFAYEVADAMLAEREKSNAS